LSLQLCRAENTHTHIYVHT